MPNRQGAGRVFEANAAAGGARARREAGGGEGS
jgi:hypothetical protein